MRVAIVVLAAGCAGQIRTEVVGQGAMPAAQPIALDAGSYEVSLAFDLPRAQLVAWSVTCPGVDSRGTLGETFEAYRARRLAELRAERDRQQHIATAIVGQAAVAVPGGAVRATAVPVVADVELPPGDVGAQRAIGSVRIVTTSAGACVVAANATGGFRVTRIRDLDAEARLNIMAANGAAMRTRSALTERLVALGADATVHRRVEAIARFEMPGDCDGDRESAADAQRTVAALQIRGRVRAQLATLGAVERPPMPEAIAETQGDAPFPGAVWSAGRWTWDGARWTWIRGGWRGRATIVVGRPRAGVVIRPAPPPR